MPYFNEINTTQKIENINAEYTEKLESESKNTTVHRNYRNLMKLAPEVIEGKYEHISFQAGEDFLQISSEDSYENCISIMYLDNSYTAPRISMELVIDSEKHTANARFFTKPPNIYDKIEDGSPQQKELNTYLSKWLKDIDKQDYVPITASYINKITKKTENIYFNSDKKPFAVGMGHLGNGITVWNKLEERHGDYKTIAHINHDRAVKFYENNLPVKIKELIEETARTSEMSVSASQPYMSVFSTPLILNKVEKSNKEMGISMDIKNDNLPYEGVLPDSTVGINERNEYGYTYNGILPLNQERALELFDKGHMIYLLYPDNTEGAAANRNDIVNFDGYFGIESVDWVKSPEYAKISQSSITEEMEYDYDIILPDPAIGYSERDLYGYAASDMLPLLKDRALELYDADLTIYMLYADGNEAMVIDRSEISGHNGIFGLEAAEWIASKEYAGMVRDLDNGEASKEAAFIFGEENAFAIYQLKRGEETYDYRFEPLDSLQSRGLEVDRKNYELVYSAPLTIRDTLVNLNKIYETFNIDPPADFTGHSLSISDVVVLQWRGEISSHYVDSIGFKELSSFLGNEHNINIEQDQSYEDLLREHIDNHADAGYLTAEDEKILLDNIDTLNEKMLKISSLYEKGMPLDTETDTIDRLFQETLKQVKNVQEKPLAETVSIKKPLETTGVHKDGDKKAYGNGKTSILSQIEKYKKTVAQGKETQKDTPKHDNDKEV